MTIAFTKTIRLFVLNFYESIVNSGFYCSSQAPPHKNWGNKINYGQVVHQNVSILNIQYVIYKFKIIASWI